MTILSDFIYLLAVSLAWPYLIYRRVTRGPSNASLRELLGGGPSRRVAGRCIWLHGVSLGEINASRTIVAEIRARDPETEVVISSTTRTGLDRARALYSDKIVFRFPLDFSFAVRRVLRRIRPSAIVLMELEVWPNLIEVAAARGIPVMIANGRVTEGKSMKRFGLPFVRSAARRMFAKLSRTRGRVAVRAWMPTPQVAKRERRTSSIPNSGSTSRRRRRRSSEWLRSTIRRSLLPSSWILLQGSHPTVSS